MKPALNLKGVKFWAIPKERLKSPPEQLLPSALSSCGLPFQSWTPPWCCSLVCLFLPPGCSEDIAPAESLLQFGQNWKNLIIGKHTINFLKMSPPGTLWSALGRHGLITTSISVLSGNKVFISSKKKLFHYKALRSMTRIPLVPVYPSFLFIFQEEKIIAEIKKWNSKYCILISDSCFQCLYADRKFWSRRYLFPHLCIRISDNTGYPDREFFFLIQEERDSFKELIAKKDQLNRMQRSVAKTFQEVLELTGSLCFMFCSTPN